MAAEKLRDLSQPMDVALLDATVEAFYATGSKEERAAADNILRDLKANPDTWLQVVHILQNTRSMHTKYFALQVIEGVIKYRWKALPVEQRNGMKNYISEVIVQILKHEWPANWRSFIPDLVIAAKTSETMCENCMVILKLLSEEIFNFSRGEMIQRKINDLKASLDRQLENLLNLFPMPEYRNLTLQCLSKVAALKVGELYRNRFVKIYIILMGHLQLHIKILETTPETIPFLLTGLEYLINISYVDDTEVFKMVYLPPTVDSIEPEVATPQKLYSDQLSKLRGLMISRMAKPEEVLIVEDENGNIVRETMKDSDVLLQYRIMRETLIYLRHFDHDDTERQEEIFLVKVIYALLSFCAIMKGNDNKAVIASNVMYVFGQYSRFLKDNWEYLIVVVKKLFDFMHATHPGVKVENEEPFVSEILSSLATIIGDPEPHQIHTLYESVACIIQAESDPQKMGEYIERLMAPPNQKWAEIIGQARRNADILKDPDVIRTVLHILQTNTRVATSLGTHFLSQISLIFVDMLNIYKMYSEFLSSNIPYGGQYASVVKLLRSAKREILKLIKTFLEKDEKKPHIGKHFVPPLMDAVLADYARNFPDARESEVLSLFAAIINQYKVAMKDEVPRIFESVFLCTLEQLKLVMDSVIWAVRHTERNIAGTGIKLLLVFLNNFKKSDFCNQFHQTYFMQIEQEIIAVLTDTFHKPEFEWHVMVLQRLFSLFLWILREVDYKTFQVESGSLTEPLWDASTVPHQYPNNADYVCECTIKLLSSAFPNIMVQEVTEFVKGLYQLRGHPEIFRNNLREFLIRSKEFSA
ncbi:hypothetical protein Bca101_084615 [Brassica carinata]